jgi:hypothetical protein
MERGSRTSDAKPGDLPLPTRLCEPCNGLLIQPYEWHRREKAEPRPPTPAELTRNGLSPPEENAIIIKITATVERSLRGEEGEVVTEVVLAVGAAEIKRVRLTNDVPRKDERRVLETAVARWLGGIDLPSEM